MRIRRDGQRYVQDRPCQAFAMQALPPLDQARYSLRNAVRDLEIAGELAPEVAGLLKWALAAVSAALEAL